MRLDRWQIPYPIFPRCPKSKVRWGREEGEYDNPREVNEGSKKKRNGRRRGRGCEGKKEDLGNEVCSK